jgi:hypothetical protein
MGLNEVEAAQALAELAADRRRSGRPSLSPGTAAWYLQALARVRDLPELPAAGLVPAPRASRPGRLRLRSRR